MCLYLSLCTLVVTSYMLPLHAPVCHELLMSDHITWHQNSLSLLLQQPQLVIFDEPTKKRLAIYKGRNNHHHNPFKYHKIFFYFFKPTDSLYNIFWLTYFFKLYRKLLILDWFFWIILFFEFICKLHIILRCGNIWCF
jgi:hypothetical protein